MYELFTQYSFWSYVISCVWIIYGGVTVLLSSIMGLWVAKTSHKNVVWAYYKIVVPIVIMVMILAACISFGAIDGSDSKTDSFIKVHNEGIHSERTRLTLLVQTQLLVTGVIYLFACFFQFISLWCARYLYDSMQQAEDSYNPDISRKLLIGDICSSALLHGHDQLLTRLHHSRRDKYLIIWACSYALYDIYVLGTFAIFAAYVTHPDHDDNSKWMRGVWTWLGDFDTRYITGDAFLITSSGFSALVLGPMLFLYAWATFVKAPFRFLFL